MKKLTSGFYLRLGVIIILIACLGWLTFASRDYDSGVLSPSVAYAAQGDGGIQGTYLEDRTGPQFGSNSLRLTSNTDFYTAAGSFDYSNGVIAPTSSNGQLVSKIYLKVPEGSALQDGFFSQLSDVSGVAYALMDKDIGIKVTFGIKIHLTSALEDAVNSPLRVAIGIGYALNDSSSNVPPQTATYSITAVGDSILTATIDMDAISLHGENSGETEASYSVDAGSRFEAYVNFVDVNENDLSKVSITSASLDISSEATSLNIDSSVGVSISVTGRNRSDVYISNIYSANGERALSNLYVKQGDTITIGLSLTGGNGAHEFDYTYAAAFGRGGDSCIDWLTFINNNYSNPRENYLDRVSAGTIYKPAGTNQSQLNAYYGYQVTYQVKDTGAVANATCLNLSPRIPKGITEIGEHTYYGTPSDPSYYITIKVDNRAPATPVIDPQSAFGACIQNNRWYTASNEIKVSFSSAVSGSDTAQEFVYAFIVDKDITSTAINFGSYDFTPSVNNYPVDRDYGYILNGRAMTARRQQIGANTASIADINKNYLRFDEPGEYALILIAVDSAGNRSDYTLYSSLKDNRPVKVDSTVRLVGAQFIHGDSAPYTPGSSSFTQFASVAVIGSSGHDSNGKCTISTDVVSGALLASANDNLVRVSRDTYVTVRIMMNARPQAYNYSLVRYVLGNSVSSSNPQPVVNSSNYYIYDITFRMDDAIWTLNDSNERAMSVYFNRRMELELITTEFTFSMAQGNYANTVSLNEGDFDIYFPNDKDQPIGVRPRVKVDYYRQLACEFYANYGVVDNKDVLTTGGYLVVDGKRYDFGASEQLLPYMEGRQKLVVDGHSFVFIKEQRHSIYDADNKIALYVIYGYDESDKRTAGVKDAGTYYYRAYIDTTDSRDYYGEKFDTFVIKQASPNVLNVKGAKASGGNLVYGDSMDKLVFTSTDDLNKVITDKIVLPNLAGGKTFYKSAAGVWGEYIISSPVFGSVDYERHNVQQDLVINVSFKPVNISEYDQSSITEYFQMFFNQFVELVRDEFGEIVGYTLIEGKSSAKNYYTQNIEVKITIEHAEAMVMPVQSDLEVFYDGNAKTVSATVTKDGDILTDVPVIVEYKLRSAGDNAYSRLAPSVAGVYDVRLTIDSARCNYNSDPYITELQISKRLLEVFVADNVEEHELLEVDSAEGGFPYHDILRYTYGHVKTADFYSAYRRADSSLEVVESLLYKYSFIKLYNYTITGELSVCVGSKWTEPSEIIGSATLNAGVYIIKVEIFNDNNEGSQYMLFYVRQASVGGSNLQVRPPLTMQAPYYNISLDGTNYGKNGHVEFGETLAEAGAKIIGTTGTARFTYAGATRETTISGRFVFESEDDYAYRNRDNENRTTLVTNAKGEHVLDVRYDDAGNVISYPVQLIWQAGSYVDGVFVENTNFLAYPTRVDIRVVRATADFTDMHLTSIVYGEKPSDATFEGSITSHGYVFAEGSYSLTIADTDKDRLLNGGHNEITCAFVPEDAHIRRYLPLHNVSIGIEVEKYEVSIAFTGGIDITSADVDGYVIEEGRKEVTHIYGSNYRDPAVEVKAYGAAVATGLQFRHYSAASASAEGAVEIDGNYYVPIDITSSTPVGKYYVMVEVAPGESNYKGSVFREYYVIRATLNYSGVVLPEKSISYGDNISSVDFGTVMLVSGACNVRGVFTVKFETSEGNYVTNYIPTEVSSTTENNVYLEFVPLAAYKDEYDNNCRPYFVGYFLRVNKRDISDNIEIFGLSGQVFDDKDKEVTVVIGGFSDVAYTIVYSETPRYAGSYEVTVGINEDVANYCGSVTAEMVIEKYAVSFSNTGTLNIPYDATSHAVEPKAIKDSSAPAGIDFNAFTYDIVYKFYDGTVTTAPLQIGQYSVRASLDDRNFEGVYEAIVNIVPNLDEEMPFTGLEQTFGALGSGVSSVAPVAPNYTKIMLGDVTVAHPTLDYTVEYYPVSGDVVSDTPTPSTPVTAGKYKVIFTFNRVRGYGPVTYTLDMNVAKAQAIFDISESYSRVYTSSNIIFACNLPAGITDATYEYKEHGVDGEYSDTRPVKAGSYDVRITLNSSNYEGVGYTVLNVLKAIPEIRSLPSVRGTIPFGSEDSSVELQNGMVIFVTTGNQISGSFSIISGDLKDRRVGKHTVPVKFTPDDGTNFEEVTELLDIEIVKRDLSEYIRFREASDGSSVIRFEYNAAERRVTPYLDEEAMAVQGITIPEDYGRILFTVTYNGLQAAPVRVNAEGYALRVVISDENYSGTKAGSKLIIEKAIPQLSLPALRTINVNDYITDAVIEAGSGYAYIVNDSERVYVRGTYSVSEIYAGTQATRANENYIVLVFTPEDGDLYYTVSSENTVLMVNGKSVDLGPDVIKVTGSEAYGAALNRFTISLVDKPSAGDLNAASIGTIAWVNPDAVINVNEQAEYIFTPNPAYYSTYNVIRGKVDVDIAPTSFRVGQGSHVYAYVGRPVGEAVIVLNMIYGVESIPVTDFTYSAIVSGMQMTDVVSGAGHTIAGVEFVLTVRHRNFNDTEVRLPVYVYRQITDFYVKSTRKYYDGNAVSIADINVTASDTDYALTDKDFYFKSIILNGSEVDEIRSAGSYTVTIAIREYDENNSGAIDFGTHSGEYTFTYVVEKRDISSYITVSGNDKIFADVERLKVSFGEYNDYVDTSMLNVTYKSVGVNGRDYGTRPPTDAGEYKVYVRLSDSDPSFIASAEFDYIIRKRAATIKLDNMYNYTYSPKLSVDIVPDISNNITSDSYVIYYTKAGSDVATTDKPVDAGSYNVRVEIIHDNYTGSATAGLTIAKGAVEITISPTIDSLNYKLKLANAEIHGGRAVSGGQEISGKFSFVNPDEDSLPVGINTVSLRFTPDNVNYAETTISAVIIILKAEGGLVYDELTAVYDGTPKYPTFHTDLKLNYRFMRDGMRVNAAIDAGTYDVYVSINDNNYEGEAYVSFTILRAKVIEAESEMPTAGSVEYGKPLNSSYLSGGKMVYVSGARAVAGRFGYSEEAMVLTAVGTYNDIKFKFTPLDTDNYEEYEGTVTLAVVKATTTISVTGNSFVYGDRITAPNFITEVSVNVKNDASFTAFAQSGPHAGTYIFTATIDDDNYTGSIIYAIDILKKPIGITFYRENYIVDRYSFTYGETMPASPRVIADSLVPGDDAEAVRRSIVCKYYSAEAKSGMQMATVTMPATVGEYYAIATINHNDYTIDEKIARISYVITKATAVLTFDANMLSEQTYGSVVVPSVLTSPTGVRVKVEFPGYPTGMPQAAGNYSIKAVVDDPNFYSTDLNAMFRINPKEIRIRNIKAENKMFDGLPDIKVRGELEGVMVGDEVKLTMTAVTRGEKVDIGIYPILITGYVLTGLHAKNYTIAEPVYSVNVKISENKITDPVTGSYITTPEGFSSNITVSFTEVQDVSVNKSNFFGTIFGQKATVQRITIKNNGNNLVLDEKVKFYAKIPDEYLKSKNLTVEGLGNLADVTTFTREGDYITFYADTSGDIVFHTNDFPYWMVIAIGALVMVVLGIVIITLTAPVRRRKRIDSGARRLYELRNNHGSFEEQYTRELKAQHEAKKRRWRM